jgi:hypothetical protein
VNAKPLLEGGGRGARFFIKVETTPIRASFTWGGLKPLGLLIHGFLSILHQIANSKNSWSKHIGFGIED